MLHSPVSKGKTTFCPGLDQTSSPEVNLAVVSRGQLCARGHRLPQDTGVKAAPYSLFTSLSLWLIHRGQVYLEIRGNRKSYPQNIVMCSGGYMIYGRILHHWCHCIVVNGETACTVWYNIASIRLLLHTILRCTITKNLYSQGYSDRVNWTVRYV